MDLFNLQNLAVGGLVAALVAFWQQARSLFTYLSSFLIVRVELDISLSTYAVQYLKAKAYRVPSGILSYRSLALITIFGLRPVPYRVLTSTNVFLVHGVPVILTLGDSAKLTSVRGLFDSDKFITEVIEFSSSLNLEVEQEATRFRVEVILGDEKGAWAGVRHRSGDVSQESPYSSGTALATYGYAQPNPAIDNSFMFPKSQLLLVSNEDPLKGLFYDKEILEHLEDAKTWKANEEWYRARSIPWRRGWLIHGPGGTGKSSLGLATALTLKYPLVQFFLNTLSDQEFIRAWDNLPTPCVVLFEDFDTVFHGRESLTEHKSLTFDCVLNKISGVKTQHGVFLIVTTNHIEHIDPAMGVVSTEGSVSTRPGRIDRTIHLGAASEEVRRKIVKHVLADWPEIHEKTVNDSAGYTVVQTQELCVQFALRKLSSKTDGGDASVNSTPIEANHAARCNSGTHSGCSDHCGHDCRIPEGKQDVQPLVRTGTNRSLRATAEGDSVS